MYKQRKFNTTSIQRCETQEGETIEMKIFRLTNNGEEVGDLKSEPIYTERKDGVLPVYNIRTNRWILAQEAMEKVSKSNEAKRFDRIKEREPKTEEKEEIGD